MYYANMGGCYCEPYEETLTKEDKRTLLLEKKAIMEAKIATINHMLDSLDKKESKFDKND